MEHKPTKQTRRLDGTVVVSANDAPRIKRLLKIEAPHLTTRCRFPAAAY